MREARTGTAGVDVGRERRDPRGVPAWLSNFASVGAAAPNVTLPLLFTNTLLYDTP